ncbi:HAD domain-containing protein [Variovorax ureilyticus]|uniref:HAD domain-containing protein n=1 Tax=Variovorax ureilyticus TaxID=1836198 RepID=UPI003D66F622
MHPARVPGAPGPSDLYMRVGPFGWLPYLAQVLQAHRDVEIVVHSTWREVYPLPELADMLAELGNRTIHVTSPGDRYAAILSWLEANPTSAYRILDDDAAEFPVPSPAELILCDGQRGVSAPEALTALETWLSQTRPL